ncbi:MAG: XRE family transcriptional regulator [Sulfurimonas sp.]|nr:XRE family transcriptional regulator [Sulfurimonas sp.]
MAITLNNHVFKGHKALLGNKYVTFGELELSQRYDIYPVSKNGFDWGNTSKSSKQLAYSMLCQVSNKELALSYTEKFLIDIIKNLNSRDWVMSTSEVLEWINKNSEQQVMQKLQPPKQAEKRVKKPKTNVVKEICKELRITQKNLAEILEVPEGTVSSWAVKNEIPRLGKKAIEFYMLNVKNQKIVDSYRSFKELLEAS